jgi:hypothetical protein
MRLQLVALVEIVYLMVRKPSGVGILVSLLVAAVAAVAVCWPLVAGRRGRHRHNYRPGRPDHADHKRPGDDDGGGG